jgi:hypothetical protein
MNERAKDGRTTADEELLVDYAERLERHRTGMPRGADSPVAMLRPYNQRLHHIRVVKHDPGAAGPAFRRRCLPAVEQRHVVALTKGASEDDIDIYVRRVKAYVQGRPAVLGATA